MCRFTLYLGPPIRLDSLLVEPAHSLILQSFSAAEREEPLNGDGFGVGWYAPELAPRPGLFRSITPAWNNANLRTLAGVVASPCVMAHVRAASPGMVVSEVNCHPFQWDGHLFMHNGSVGSFHDIRRKLLAGLGDDAFDIIRGSTDSEHLFAVFMEELAATDTEDEHRLATALNRAVWRVQALVDEVRGEYRSYLNLAVTDGERAVACRFTDHPTRPPESLYLIEGALYAPVVEGAHRRRTHEDSRTFVVSSERLTDDPGWRAIEPNQMVSLSRDAAPTAFRMEPGGLVAA